MDTIKTRLVTQLSVPDLPPYRGMIDCAHKVYAEEGLKAFYRGLPPRLLSVVPMIGIQFGLYEFMKKVMLANSPTATLTRRARKSLGSDGEMEQVMMGVAADDDQPNNPPRIKTRKK